MTALMAFERAATHLSFRRAAQDLGLSPSAVSHQIRGLEERFGARLFARGARAVRLTAAGESYRLVVAAALAQLDEAGRDLLGQATGGRTELRVSALPFFTSTVILPALADLPRHHPGLTLRLETSHQYADLDSAGVDVAIRFGRERSSGLRFEPLVEVRSLPVCRPDKLGALSTPAALADEVLIHVTQQPRAWPVWLESVGQGQLKPRGELWVDSMPAALEAAEHGLGVTIAMHPLIRGRPGFGETLAAPFAPTGRTGAFYLVMRPEQAQERRIIAFRRWLAEAVERVTGP